MKSLPVWIALLSCLGLASCAKTSTGPKFPVLGTGHFTAMTRASTDDPVYTFFSVDTGLGRTAALFDTIAFDTTKVGREFEASGTDTNFVTVATRLADGARSVVCTGDCDRFSCVTYCSDEKFFFGLGTTDFAPGMVQQVNLRVDSTAVGPNPFGGTVRLYFFTLTVFGTR